MSHLRCWRSRWSSRSSGRLVQELPWYCPCSSARCTMSGRSPWRDPAAKDGVLASCDSWDYPERRYKGDCGWNLNMPRWLDNQTCSWKFEDALLKNMATYGRCWATHQVFQVSGWNDESPCIADTVDLQLQPLYSYDKISRLEAALVLFCIRQNDRFFTLGAQRWFPTWDLFGAQIELFWGWSSITFWQVGTARGFSTAILGSGDTPS